MQDIVRKPLWITAAAMLGLAATTAMAGLKTQDFPALLRSVSRLGYLYKYQTITTFDALVNTSTGAVIGTATGKVYNDSHELQVYVDGDFGWIKPVAVCSSLYIVTDEGNALLIATGHVANP